MRWLPCNPAKDVSHELDPGVDPGSVLPHLTAACTASVSLSHCCCDVPPLQGRKHSRFLNVVKRSGKSQKVCKQSESFISALHTWLESCYFSLVCKCMAVGFG